MKYLKALILILLFSYKSFAQLKTTKYFGASKGFCSTTLILDSLGFFFYEQGCEGRSSIAYGKYNFLDKNLIEFEYQKFDSLPDFLKIINRNFSPDSFITLKFLTRQGSLIPSSNINIDAIDSSGKFFETIKFNDSAEVRINYKKYKELRIFYLNKLLNRKVKIPLSNQNQIFYLSLPTEFLYYSCPKVQTPNNMKLYLKEDGLYRIDNKTIVYSLIK